MRVHEYLKKNVCGKGDMYEHRINYFRNSNFKIKELQMFSFECMKREDVHVMKEKQKNNQRNKEYLFREPMTVSRWCKM